MGSAYILNSDGTKIQLARRPTLKAAQQIVGGYIEFVKVPNTNKTLVVNEDGKMKGLPLNMEATAMYWHSPIVGDVIVLTGWKTVR